MTLRRFRALLFSWMSIPVLVLCLTGGNAASAEPVFLRGDVNTDGEVSISDALMLRRWIYNGDRSPTCLNAADTNDDGAVDFSDAVVLVRRLFMGDPAFPPPYPEPGKDPTLSGADCESYEVQPPEETEDVIRFGDIEAAPGEEVAVPVYLSAGVPIEAVQLVVDYDPAIFTPLSGLPIASESKRREFFAGSVIEDLFYPEVPDDGDRCREMAFCAVSSSSDEGVFTFGFIPSFICEGYEFPVGSDVRAFNILGTVSEDAAPGTTVVLEPTNGPGGLGFGPDRLRNELTHRGDARFVTVLPRTIPAMLRIIPELSVFIRGDSNGDAAVDISDAQATLDYLFLGSQHLPCLDAADADDDGELTITDPILTLDFLFLGGGPLPPPADEPGKDTTPDPLDCARGL